MPVKAVRSQIASAIDVVIQIERMEDGRRRLVSLQEIDGMEGEIITMSEIFRFERTGVDADNNVQGFFTATGVVPKFREHLSNVVWMFRLNSSNLAIGFSTIYLLHQFFITKPQ